MRALAAAQIPFHCGFTIAASLWLAACGPSTPTAERATLESATDSPTQTAEVSHPPTQSSETSETSGAIPDGWRRYGPSDGSFSIAFPNRPRETAESDSEGSASRGAYDDSGYTLFRVEYMGANPGSMGGTVDATLEHLVNVITHLPIESGREVSLDGHPGREFIASGPDEVVVGRVYVVDQRLYLLSTRTHPDPFPSQAASVWVFLDSFRLNSGRADPSLRPTEPIVTFEPLTVREGTFPGHSGEITFGTDYDQVTLEIIGPSVEFKLDRRLIAWSASLSEEVHTSEIDIQITEVTPAAERLIYKDTVRVSNRQANRFASRFDLAGLAQRKAGTYRMSFIRFDEGLAEGTFTLVD